MDLQIFKIEEDTINISKNDIGKWKYFHQLLRDKIQQFIIQDITTEELINHKINLEDITHLFVEKYQINEGHILVGLKKSNYGSYLVWYFIPFEIDNFYNNQKLQNMLYPIINKFQYKLMCNTIDTAINTLYPKSLVLNHEDLIKNNIKQLECNIGVLQQNIAEIDKSILRLKTHYIKPISQLSIL